MESSFNDTRRTIIDPYLVGLLLLSLFLRLYRLDGQSIWLDEAYSVQSAKLNLFQIYFLHDNTPPLYHAILHWWIQLFGISEFSLRLPSAILGVFSVFIMYKIGSLLFDVEAGRLSSFLLTISLFHIRYSQEARAYSLSALLTLVSMYYFIKVLKKMSNQNLIGYVISSLLLLYSHIYGLFVIIAQNIYYFSVSFLSMEGKQGNFRKWILIQCLLIGLFAPWIGILVTQIQYVLNNGFWTTKPGVRTVLYSFYTYSSDSSKLLFVFIALTILSATFFEKRRGNLNWKSFFGSLEGYQWTVRLLNTDQICFLLVWLMTPIILPFIISLFSQPIYLTKYTIVASVAFFLLVAKGLSNIHNRYIKSFIIIIISAFSLMQAPSYYTEINKEQWRDVAKYVDTNFHKGDLIIIEAPYCAIPFNYYSSSAIIRNEYDSQASDKDVDVDSLGKSVAHYDRVWLVLSHFEFVHGGSGREQIEETLTKMFDLSAQKEYYGIKLYLFVSKSISTSAESRQ
jgi:uncharacterized membrane protein